MCSTSTGQPTPPSSSPWQPSAFSRSRSRYGESTRSFTRNSRCTIGKIRPRSCLPHSSGVMGADWLNSPGSRRLPDPEPSQHMGTQWWPRLPFSCASTSLSKGHLHPVFGAQREGRVRHDRMIRYEVHLVLLDNGRQDQLGFDHGELATNADPRSTPEGEVGEPGSVGGCFAQETLRSELVRSLPEFGVPVGEELPENNRRLGRDVVTHDLVSLDRLSGHPPGRRVEPHRLLENRPTQRQVWQVRCRWRPSIHPSDRFV